MESSKEKSVEAVTVYNHPWDRSEGLSLFRKASPLFHEEAVKKPITKSLDSLALESFGAPPVLLRSNGLPGGRMRSSGCYGNESVPEVALVLLVSLVSTTV